VTPEELHNIYRAESEFWWYQGMRSITWTLLDPLLPRGLSKGLDAGCGTGMNAREIESRYGVRMHGVDLAKIGIDYCHKRDFERAAVASVTDLPFPDQAFDLVSSMDVLQCLRLGSDEGALREFYRVLRPGGWLVLRVAAFQALRSRHAEFIAERHRYRSAELLGKLDAAKFRVLRWTYVNSFLSPVALVKFRVWENLTKQEPHSGVTTNLPSWLNRLLLGVLKTEAALLRSGFRFGFGQSLMAVARKAEPGVSDAERNRA
jgi:SAM-dependent methyltransferase